MNDKIVIPKIKYKYNENYLIFGVFIEIYLDFKINTNILKMYNYPNDKIFTNRKIYCIKNESCLSNILKNFDFAKAKIIHSYTKSSYYEINNIFVRDNLSHIVIRKKNNIYLIYSDKTKNINNILWCIIREIIHRNTEDRGGIMLHSAALSTSNNNDILILGEKGAGKTTLMTSLLEFNDYLFSSNERILIRREDNKGFSIHYPLRFGIRNIINNSLLEQYVFNNYEKLSRKQNITLELIEKYRKNRYLPEEDDLKLELEINEFIECYSKSYKPFINPKIIIIPKISSNVHNYNILVLNKEELKSKIKEQCYTPYDKTWTETWVEKRKKTEKEIIENVDKLINEISENVIGIQIEYGYDFYKLLKNKKINYFKEEIEKNIHIYNKRAN